jgi:DNA-binding response OmpR family regulator
MAATDSLKKVPYIEDEPHTRHIARIALEAVGDFTVRTCRSGREALQVALDFKPDRILLDAMAPEMDGTATREKPRSFLGLRATPNVFMTAKTAPRDVAGPKGVVAIEVIAKPFNPIALPATVREICTRRHREVQDA